MTDRETDELGTVSAEEALIRSSVKDISSDLAEEASMFAAASESSAPADGVGIVPAKRSSGSRRTPIRRMPSAPRPTASTSSGPRPP